MALVASSGSSRWGKTKAVVNSLLTWMHSCICQLHWLHVQCFNVRLSVSDPDIWCLILCSFIHLSHPLFTFTSISTIQFQTLIWTTKQGCALQSHAYMYGKKIDDRYGDIDIKTKVATAHSKICKEPPPQHEFSYRWFRGPEVEFCAYKLRSVRPCSIRPIRNLAEEESVVSVPPLFINITIASISETAGNSQPNYR